MQKLDTSADIPQTEYSENREQQVLNEQTPTTEQAQSTPEKHCDPQGEKERAASFTDHQRLQCARIFLAAVTPTTATEDQILKLITQSIARLQNEFSNRAICSELNGTTKKDDSNEKENGPGRVGLSQAITDVISEEKVEISEIQRRLEKAGLNTSKNVIRETLARMIRKGNMDKEKVAHKNLYFKK